MVYNYEFTQTHVDFFLEGSNLGLLGGEWTQNQVFRVVVVPATQVNGVDTSDINTVIALGDIQNFEVR